MDHVATFGGRVGSFMAQTSDRLAPGSSQTHRSGRRGEWRMRFGCWLFDTSNYMHHLLKDLVMIYYAIKMNLTLKVILLQKPETPASPAP